MKNISILGSTGSIGVSALDVIGNSPDRFNVVALSACTNIGLLTQQIDKFRPQVASVIDEVHARELKKKINPSVGVKILFGEDGYREVASIKHAHMVISSMVGSAGLIPTIEAIEAGKDIALANKEVLVMAGPLVVNKAREKNVKILPVDSEHNAIFQCITGQKAGYIKKIILTASGGPFLHLSKDELAGVKPADALKHPCWKMGRKITIDSATMMNKGLEIIEARWLFHVDMENIDVLIHPQSVVHSMVEFIDGTIMAQLSIPDMRIPIAYALSFPERIINRGPSLDLLKVGAFEFLPPDMEKFPNLILAVNAGKTGGTMPAAMNAANEVAVDAFLKGKIRFTDISKLIGAVLSCHQVEEASTLGKIIEADRWARNCTEKFIERINIVSC
jgi:1-deoxy-D-xylulose-5-phosphate reductoisomerase